MESDPGLWAAVGRAASLRQLPGVTGIGVGRKRIGGVETPANAICVFVHRKRPLSEVDPDEVIPTRIDGYPTDVTVMTNIRYATGAAPGTVFDPLPPGEPPGTLEPPNEPPTLEDCVRGLAAGDPVAGRRPDAGATLGPLLQGRFDVNKRYALTCFHVLCKVKTIKNDDGDVVAQTIEERPELNDRVGQVKPNGCLSHCCNDCFGTYVGGDFLEHTWIDYAVIQLDSGTRYFGAVKGVGPVPKGSGPTPGVAPAPASPVLGQHPYVVRKYGTRTRLTGGRVVKIVDDAPGSHGSSYVVLPHPRTPNEKEYHKLHFALPGDSGGPVVTPDGRLVGIITRVAEGELKDYFPGNPPGIVNYTLVSPIGSVLQRIHDQPPRLDLIPVLSVSSGDIHTAPPATGLTAHLDGDRVSVHLPDAPLPSAAGSGLPGPSAELRADLAATTLGRLVLDVWQRHGPELYELVNHDRRVLATWHRSGASAVFQRLARAPGLEAAELPRTVNGVPLRECVDRLYTVLAQQAGTELQAALGRLHARLPDVAGLRYRQVLAAFAAAGD